MDTLNRIVSLMKANKIKEELREVAESQHRSMSNLIELIIRQYIDAHKKTEE